MVITAGIFTTCPGSTVLYRLYGPASFLVTCQALQFFDAQVDIAILQSLQTCARICDIRDGAATRHLNDALVISKNFFEELKSGGGF